MTVLLTVPRAVRGPMTVSIPDTAIPTGLVKASCTVNRFAWATAELQFSFDDGASFSGTCVTVQTLLTNF